MEQAADLRRQVVVAYSIIALWISLSATVILINKYILAQADFPFPISLTLTHMAFSSLVSFGLIQGGIVPAVSLDRDTYMRTIVPIAALFSGTLWLGNAAYLYLSVSFIQMLKALMPAMVFATGIFLGTEMFSWPYAGNMGIVTFGVAVASWGELNFNLVGVLSQLGSQVSESLRLSLIQILLQGRGIKLNPITTLYYVAPACFCFLLLPWLAIELPQMRVDTTWSAPVGLLTISATAALALNVSVFLLIGKTSALTMNIAGVIKDWLLILLSSMLFKSPVTPVQLGGYFVAFLGVCYYNYLKMQSMTAASSASAGGGGASLVTASPGGGQDGKPLSPSGPSTPTAASKVVESEKQPLLSRLHVSSGSDSRA